MGAVVELLRGDKGECLVRIFVKRMLKKPRRGIRRPPLTPQTFLLLVHLKLSRARLSPVCPYIRCSVGASLRLAIDTYAHHTSMAN